MQNRVKSIEDILRDHFIPSITGKSSIPEHLRQLIALTIPLEGMAVAIPHLNTDSECNASRLLSADILDHIIGHNIETQPKKEGISEIKDNINKGRAEAENNKLSKIRENLSKDYITAKDILQQPYCTNSLTGIPTEEFKYTLNKQQLLHAM